MHTFVFYRIIGNDLYPRHRQGQSQNNVRFILDNEPEFDGCTKRWIVNRIVNRQDEETILSLLDERGQTYDRIPFNHREYAQVGWDLDWLPTPEFLHSPQFHQMSENDQLKVEQRIRRLKVNYVMNVNGARNIALRQGRALAQWIMPWDGNCFLTEEAWFALRCAVASDIKYISVPMARLTDNRQALDQSCANYAVEEPQLIFRADAAEEFNENYPYGWRCKVELLRRLGIPGRWDKYETRSWDLPELPRSPEAGQFAIAGWVNRLDSGYPILERGSQSLSLRGRARRTAILTTIDQLDQDILRTTFNKQTLTSYRIEALNHLRTATPDDPLALVALRLRHDADAALARGRYSVVEKESLPPSGDWHDYVSLAPYWWPNPETPDGLPYIKRDGYVFPPAQLQGDTNTYDRTRLNRLFQDTTCCAIAWISTGERKYAQHSADLIRTWFIDASTRMNPHLHYAQMRLGHNGNSGQPFGIIEMKDLYYLLDAVRIIQQSGELSEDDLVDLHSWLSNYQEWLVNSPFGRQEVRRPNNHGLYYDLQLAAIAAFLDDVESLCRIFRRFQERIMTHFDPDGSQPKELLRANPVHYCCFNLQGWANLGILGDRCGVNLWTFETADGRSLRQGLETALSTFTQSDDLFDTHRLLPLRLIYDEYYAEPKPSQDLILKRYANAEYAMFSPTDGIKPYWFL